MIERYSDHAANERTFLAWVRTAIAIMAFGFLVQKFDLFLRIAGQSLARPPLARLTSPTQSLAAQSLAAQSLATQSLARPPLAAQSLPAAGSIVGTIAGLLLIVLGGAMMALAALRFRKTMLDIDAAEIRPGPGARLDITLAGLLFLLGAILFVYLVYTLVDRL
jgi:putative membrane protein